MSIKKRKIERKVLENQLIFKKLWNHHKMKLLFFLTFKIKVDMI